MEDAASINLETVIDQQKGVDDPGEGEVDAEVEDGVLVSDGGEELVGSPVVLERDSPVMDQLAGAANIERPIPAPRRTTPVPALRRSTRESRQPVRFAPGDYGSGHSH